MKVRKAVVSVGMIVWCSVIAFAQEETKPPASDAAERAKKLANPVASLISIPFQNNMDVGIGDFNGSRNTLNIQPVIPINLSPKLNLIARIILPVISQHDIYGENTQQNGLGDALTSAFFAPVESKHGVISGLVLRCLFQQQRMICWERKSLVWDQQH